MLRALFFLLTLLFPLHSATASADSGDMQLDLEVLEDPQGRFNIEAVTGPLLASRFSPLLPEAVQQGFTQSVFWVRFTLGEEQLRASPLLLELDYPLIDYVTLYVDTGGSYLERTSGDRVPFSLREVKHHNPLFVLEQKSNQSHTYYLRFETQGSMPLRLRLWSPLAFAEHLDLIQLWYGGYYGLLLVLTLVSLVAFLYLRSRLFLYYTLYISSYLLLQLVLNGFAFQYLWPEQPWWASHAVVVFMMLPLPFGLLFAGHFLGVWELGGIVKRVFQALIGMSLLAAVSGFAFGYTIGVKLAMVTAIIVMPCVVLATIIAISRGFRPARLFLFAYTCLFVGALISQLSYLGLGPHHFYTINAVQIGSVFEFLILMMAMAHRMRILLHSKEEAQARANYYMNQLNRELEQLVDNRTHALAESNRLLRDQAMRDSLTGILNHRAILERLDEELGAANRYRNPIAVLMMDLDYFKQLNDSFGHQAGDWVLVAVANLLQESMRRSDHCGRYGGEEFLIVLSHVTRTEAMEWAERIRREIAALVLDGLPQARITCSLGVAVYIPEEIIEITSSSLIRLADKLLYQAKEAGRNRITIALTRDAKRYGIELVGNGAADPAG